MRWPRAIRAADASVVLRDVVVEPPRRVQKRVAQTLGFGLGQFALEHQALGEGDEVLGHADQLDPAGVVGEVAEGQVAQPGVFGATDAVLDAGMAAVAGFE